ncbi:MAG: MoaD/ThiS family protein [Gammaproteobacteria bacterium]
MRLNVVYLASVRERVGRHEEQIEIAQHACNLGDLLALLSAKYAGLFNDPDIGCAVSGQIQPMHTSAITACQLQDEDEIAFFPPMTGG